LALGLGFLGVSSKVQVSIGGVQGFRGMKFKVFNCLRRSSVQLPAAFKCSIACGVQRIKCSIACGVQVFNCLETFKGLIWNLDLEFGSWNLDLGISNLRSTIYDSGPWNLDLGIWILVLFKPLTPKPQPLHLLAQ
jgi:hypothetical protein